MLLSHIGEHLFFAQDSVVEVRDLAVVAVDVIQDELTGRQGLASLGCSGAANATDTGEVYVQVIDPFWVVVAYFERCRARRVARITVYAKLHVVDVFVSRNHRLGI